MDDLIQALQIFRKYLPTGKTNGYYTNCLHDVLLVCGIEPDAVSSEDVDQLRTLGFTWDDEYDCWSSYRHGSC